MKARSLFRCHNTLLDVNTGREMEKIGVFEVIDVEGCTFLYYVFECHLSKRSTVVDPTCASIGVVLLQVMSSACARKNAGRID